MPSIHRPASQPVSARKGAGSLSSMPKTMRGQANLYGVGRKLLHRMCPRGGQGKPLQSSSHGKSRRGRPVLLERLEGNPLSDYLISGLLLLLVLGVYPRVLFFAQSTGVRLALWGSGVAGRLVLIEVWFAGTDARCHFARPADGGRRSRRRHCPDRVAAVSQALLRRFRSLDPTTRRRARRGVGGGTRRENGRHRATEATEWLFGRFHPVRPAATGGSRAVSRCRLEAIGDPGHLPGGRHVHQEEVERA